MTTVEFWILVVLGVLALECKVSPVVWVFGFDALSEKLVVVF
jgi:hypothetical protein